VTREILILLRILVGLGVRNPYLTSDKYSNYIRIP